MLPKRPFNNEHLPHIKQKHPPETSWRGYAQVVALSQLMGPATLMVQNSGENSPVEVGSLFPLFTRFYYTHGGCLGFLPSTGLICMEDYISTKVDKTNHMIVNHLFHTLRIMRINPTTDCRVNENSRIPFNLCIFIFMNG